MSSRSKAKSPASNRTTSRLPVTSASLLSVLIFGERPPSSSRAITDCVVPIRRASSPCVSRARIRAAIISRRKADAGFIETSSSAKAVSRAFRCSELSFAML